jgi:hypothetical protein
MGNRDGDVMHPVDGINRTIEKFLRDFIINLTVVVPFFIAEGGVNFQLLLPSVGLAAYRSYRDVIVPAIKLYFASRGLDADK